MTAPTPFPWQMRQWRELIARHRAGRMPHALLLTGPAGVGKRGFAEALIAALLCQSPDSEGRACGVCRSCVLLAAGTHPDQLVVQPAEEGKRITVDQVRALSNYQALKPEYGRHKLILIDPAEQINLNGANALLKTLEEPTEGTLLLLVSAHPARLLPTVRSRCQRLVFPLPASAECLPWLEQALGTTGGADVLLAAAGGSPLAAVDLAATDGMERREERFAEFEALLLGHSDPLTVAAGWVERPAQHLTWLYGWTADMIRLKCGPDHALLTNPALRVRLQGLAEPLDLTTLHDRLDRTQSAIRALSGQVNAQLLIEDLLIAWA